ncbi:TetR/AcrR family transcriptional regulator [Oceanobacillus piezotolerans]|nr:TetR/AcrR family transcriptional regulator [Oceanobacillus piezotolerans]
MNQKKKQIIDAAQRLFIKKGFSSTSIQDILDEAEIAKGTFYNYFSSKNECLMAILELISEEIIQERIHLAYGKERDDESVFAAQMAVRFNIDKKHNLMALFSTVRGSEDKDLQAFLDKQYVMELHWVANRLKEIYGQEIDSLSYDYAIIFLGIVQQAAYVVKRTKPSIDQTEAMIQFSLNRISSLIETQSGVGNAFFHEEDFYKFLNVEEPSLDVLKQQIVETLNEINEARFPEKEYYAFIIEELQREKPRMVLLESIFLTLSKEVEGTINEGKIRKVSSLAWRLIEREKRKRLK